MNKQTTSIKRRKALWMCLPLLALTACQDDVANDPHYKAPDFLVGNAIKVLENDGNYSTFLRGVELIGYTDVLSTQLLTVLAPTDEAFSSFLQTKGYASIDEMFAKEPEQLKQVITYHLIYFAMDWEKMTNFRPSEGDGATLEDKAFLAGMYNRFRTRCQEPMTKEFNNEASIRDYVDVVHYDRYLTVFSEKLFRTLGIDAASNYNYFFPGTQWNPTGNPDGFNIMNAAVLDKEAVVTDNGYLYHIDHVLEPCGTIYEELATRGDYKMFTTLFDQYAYYERDITESEKRGYEVYGKRFRDLPDIAMEWASKRYEDYLTNSVSSWNVMAPTDEAMRKMFSEYWEPNCGYTSVETLNPLIQRIMLNECVFTPELDASISTKSSYMCYPAFIDNQQATSAFNTLITTKSEEFEQRIACNNGIILGTNKMEVPGVFASAVGPAFKDVRFLPFLYVLDGSGTLTNFASNATKHVALVPDTTQFAAERMRLFRTVVDGVSEYALQQWNDEASDYANMSTSVMKNIVAMNTADEVSEIPTKGTAVIETNQSYNYWFVNNGKITTNALFNQQLNPSFTDSIWYEFKEIKRGGDKTWSNGRAYSYSYPGIYQPVTAESLEQELSQNNDRNYPYYCFSQLLRLAGLAADGAFTTTGANTIRNVLDMKDNRFIAFIPSNEAIKASLKSLPGCANLSISEQFAISGKPSNAQKEQLAAYLLSYFIVRERCSFTAYPYLGSSCKGDFATNGTFGITINDNGTELSVNATGKTDVVKVQDKYNYLPFAFSDGAFQLIDGVLK